MLDVIIDCLIDSLKLLPYLFLTFLILELIEHKLDKKSKKVLTKNKKYGPILGALLGALPQCGFSTMASNLFSSRVITIGTLIAVFLSTSDEMIPVMLSENASITLILKIIGFKIVIGMFFGIIIDLFYKTKEKEEHIHDLCEKDHCHCEHDGIFKSSIIHTLKTGLFILIANLVLGFTIYFVGEETLENLLLNKNIFVYLIASLVGLIPNCASSVIMTHLYVTKLISIGTLMIGLLTGSGLGILMLFKTNKNKKENIIIVIAIVIIGVLVGSILDLIV